jgi:succinate dehydrogenase hydrophobic anchor subunit
MRLFIIQRVSAVAMVIFMTIHMVVVHYPVGHIDFSRVLVRLEDPLWKVIDILFLFFVLLHALAGAYAVATDYDTVAKYKRSLAAFAVVIGTIFFIYGAVTIWAFQLPA